MGKPAPPELALIYETHHGKVRAYAARLLGPDDADDVAQDVFIKVGRSLETLADPSRLESWIFAITLNTIRDAARKRASGPLAAARRAPAPREPEEEAGIPDPGSRTPEAILARSEMVTCYLDYVRQLPPSYYEVYVLSEFEDLPNEEIARRLSVSVGTVKIRLHRARTRLRGELRRNCRCYYDERGELMGGPKDN